MPSSRGIRITAQANEVHVLFNNNAQGAGTRNALALATMLGLAPKDAPDLPAEQRRLFEDDASS